MEGAILSSPGNGRFRAHLKNAASAICARTLPKQRRTETLLMAAATRHHHTYPRVAPPRRAAIPARLEPLTRDLAADLPPPPAPALAPAPLPVPVPAPASGDSDVHDTRGSLTG
ncbi:hypothetical protein EVAR_48174_1 [Eumeta japonica]|uniref:Uncharacterized protein n=1 Tax=Eumeta variegata TaxID=151549 RepID=A0A4C1XTE3_EUMVA|nr:hypothetical protein EVAR_48174_1 [Eumeta japonica]